MTEKNIVRKLEQKIRELVPRLTNTGCSNIEGHLCFRCADPFPLDLDAVLEAAITIQGVMIGAVPVSVAVRLIQFKGMTKGLKEEHSADWHLGKPWEEQGEELYEFLFNLFFNDSK